MSRDAFLRNFVHIWRLHVRRRILLLMQLRGRHHYRITICQHLRRRCSQSLVTLNDHSWRAIEYLIYALDQFAPAPTHDLVPVEKAALTQRDLLSLRLMPRR